MHRQGVTSERPTLADKTGFMPLREWNLVQSLLESVTTHASESFTGCDRTSFCSLYLKTGAGLLVRSGARYRKIRRDAREEADFQ